MKLQIYLLLFSFIFQFCTSSVTPEELKKYVQNPKNGLRKEFQLNDEKISLTFIPGDLLISSEIRNKQINNQELIDSMQKLYCDKAFFQMGFTYKDSDLLQKYILNESVRSEIVSYFSYDIANDVKIIAESDTTYCLSSIYAPTYGFSKSNNILLTFNKESINNAKEFSVNYKGYHLGFRTLSFQFKQKDIKKIPPLDFS